MELLPEHKLGRQLAAVHWHMTKRYQEWWTLEQLRAALLAEGIGISEAGVSARIRDLRKPPLNLIVDRQPTARKGVIAYRVRS
jgi:hypothetical protein